MLFAPSQSLCESTAFAEKCSAGCCCLPEPSLAVGETRIQRKPPCLGMSPGKAQHSLGNQSWFWGCCCCLPELVSAAGWKIPAWSEILFALASLLPEREAWSHMSVTALPTCKCGRPHHAAPGEEKEPLALGLGNAPEAGSPTVEEQQASGKTSVTRSLCGEMEAFLLWRHEGTTRAWARAPL